MQFRLAKRASDMDLRAMERELHVIDSAAVVDRDDAREQLRISTFLSVPELIAAIGRAGCSVTRDEVIPVKSECCGGCGG